MDGSLGGTVGCLLFCLPARPSRRPPAPPAPSASVAPPRIWTASASLLGAQRSRPPTGGHDGEERRGETMFDTARRPARSKSTNGPHVKDFWKRPLTLLGACLQRSKHKERTERGGITINASWPRPKVSFLHTCSLIPKARQHRRITCAFRYPTV